MKRSFIVHLLLLVSLAGFTQTMQRSSGTFTLGDKTFLLNGKPFVVRAAEIHYPRIPKEYWNHRIQLSKAMGMNTICIYLFWNYHEQQEGSFDFEGQKDVAAFVKLVQDNGMYCIVRPGPYACAEWDMGGLPWWLLKKKDVQVRTANDAYFLERSRLYMNEVGKQLAPLQIQNGGNIIMVQVENEYASFGSEQRYMEEIKKAVIDAGFDKVQLFRCDWSSNFTRYKLEGVATTINFGAGSNIDNQFKGFKEVYPNAPLMCSEYWTGWFDHWGKPHETRSTSSFIGSLKDMLDRKISFSLYMAHGGTSFGQWGGANAPPYSAMATSYDYNAPIGEQGNTTDKFFAVRDLLKNYLQEGETLGKIPDSFPVIEIPAFRLNQSAALFDNLPAKNKSESIQPMEMFDQGWGRILYRSNIPASPVKRTLQITEVHDWATVFLNGKPLAKLDRRRGDDKVEIPPVTSAARLDILVEATGRVNYGQAIIDRKGITKSVELISGKNRSEILHWEIYNFPVDYEFQKKARFQNGPVNGPAWYRGTFHVNTPGDTFLDLGSWGKGMVWVNGYNLGRFWKIGPQQTLYMPGCWLRKGENEIIILDVDKPTAAMVAGLNKPVLDKLRPDESLLHRTKEQQLSLAAEKPVATGTFAPGNGWKEVCLTSAQKGRYFCLEALNAQQENDPLTTIAELELTTEDGSAISGLKWKIIYADSEEVTSENHAADKIYDKQESTFWQTRSVGVKPPHPHQVVIDLGEAVRVKCIRYLPRSDKSVQGMIRDYRIFLKEKPFRF